MLSDKEDKNHQVGKKRGRFLITFGPVPSRRVGQSLGINNIPPKACTYSCVYCQLGRTLKPEVKPRNFYGAEEILKHVAAFIGQLSPDTSYLSVPIRPPTEMWVLPPTEDTLIRSFEIMNSKIDNVEYLIGYEGNAFAFTGDVEKDLLSITAVHPMREEAVNAFLDKAAADWSVVDQLIDKGMLVVKVFQGSKFYARKLFPPRSDDMLGFRME